MLKNIAIIFVSYFMREQREMENGDRTATFIASRLKQFNSVGTSAI